MLLGWSARGDQTFGWILFIVIWLTTLANASLMLTIPLPYLYDGVATKGGLIVSTSSFRRWVSGISALADAVLLPAMPGGAIAAMGAALGVRAVMVLYFTTVSAHCCSQRAAERAARTANDPSLRTRAAEAALRSGLLARDGRIRAAHVFEFHPAGPHKGWRWIWMNGAALGQFETVPFAEYAAVAQAGRVPPGCLWP